MNPCHRMVEGPKEPQRLRASVDGYGPGVLVNDEAVVDVWFFGSESKWCISSDSRIRPDGASGDTAIVDHLVHGC